MEFYDRPAKICVDKAHTDGYCWQHSAKPPPTNVMDACGECWGDGSACSADPCVVNPDLMDICGVCNGDGSSCDYKMEHLEEELLIRGGNVSEYREGFLVMLAYQGGGVVKAFDILDFSG